MLPDLEVRVRNPLLQALLFIYSCASQVCEAAALSSRVIAWITTVAEAAIAERGVFAVAVAGGSVLELLKELRKEEARTNFEFNSIFSIFESSRLGSGSVTVSGAGAGPFRIAAPRQTGRICTESPQKSVC